MTFCRCQNFIISVQYNAQFCARVPRERTKAVGADPANGTFHSYLDFVEKW